MAGEKIDVTFSINSDMEEMLQEAAEKYKRVADMPLDDRVEVVAVCSSIRGEEPVAQVAQIERTGDKAKLLHWHEVKMTENNGFGLYKW